MVTKLKVFILVIIPVLASAECITEFSETYVTMLTDEVKSLDFLISCPAELQNVTLHFKVQHKGNLLIWPNFTTIDVNTTSTKITLDVEAVKAGETNIFVETLTPGLKSTFVTIQVYKSEAVEILSIIIGWIYFFAWSISFYPQIYENYKSRSVVGLNFDFVVVNITGYVLYSAFNLGLCYIPSIRMQYENRYPFSRVSVLPNDIVFSVHALVVTLYTGAQCLWYEKGDQTISWFGKAFHYISALALLGTAALCVSDYVLWLDFFYICSYIKLSVTFCKYGPQAVMNYKRKSTKGWSIETVLLDVAGGICSVLQMFMNAYNYDKWAWIMENPTKLWLGIFSLLFDFFFMFQHYYLYNEKRKSRKRQEKSDIILNSTFSEKEMIRL